MPAHYNAHCKHAYYYVTVRKSANEVFLRKAGAIEGLKTFDDAWENIQAAYIAAMNSCLRGFTESPFSTQLSMI